MPEEILSRKSIASADFLCLESIEYRGQDGRVHSWEAVQRKGTNSAAVIIATMRPSNRIVLIRQFRPPMGKYVIELPAGLIEPGEDPLVCAARELAEETGFTGIPAWHTGPTVSSAGLSGETLDLVSVDIDENAPENLQPKQNLQDNEAIQVFPVAIDALPEFLHQALQNDDAIDSRLAAWTVSKNMRW